MIWCNAHNHEFFLKLTATMSWIFSFVSYCHPWKFWKKRFIIFGTFSELYFSFGTSLTCLQGG